MDAETPILTHNKDFVKAEGDEAAPPPVHPYLVEYLRDKFSPRLPDIGDAEKTYAVVQRQLGQQEVINFLANLSQENKQ